MEEEGLLSDAGWVGISAGVMIVGIGGLFFAVKKGLDRHEEDTIRENERYRNQPPVQGGKRRTRRSHARRGTRRV